MAAGYVSIGERIAILRRRRGLSQAVVAGQLGRSVQWLANIELGVRRAHRYSILVPIAEVLGMPVAGLSGDAPAESSEPSSENTAGQAVRVALSGHGFVSVEPDGCAPVIDLDALRQRVRSAWTHVHDAWYGELGQHMPELIADCERAAWTVRDEQRGEAFGLLAELYQAVAAMMAKLGESDAAWVAARGGGDRAPSPARLWASARATSRRGYPLGLIKPPCAHERMRQPMDPRQGQRRRARRP